MNTTAINTKRQKSKATGPKTPEGKKRAAMNATRHGLAGRIVVLPTEDMNHFHRFSKELVDSLRPANAHQREIAQTIADGYWRLRRLRTTEDTLFALGHEEGHGDFDAAHPEIHAAYTNAKAFRANTQAFATLSIYEQRIHRGIEKATKQLEALQAAHKASWQSEDLTLLRLHDLHKMQNLPYDPTSDGFVYSREEVEVFARRRDRIELARLAERVDFNLEEFQKKAA
jgi:hypothetical protein